MALFMSAAAKFSLSYFMFLFMATSAAINLSAARVMGEKQRNGETEMDRRQFLMMGIIDIVAVRELVGSEK